VLRSLAPQLSEMDGANLVSARAAEADEAFKDVGTFLALPELAGKQPPPDAAAVTVSSEWFVFESQASVGQARARLASLLHRTSQGVDVIQRRREFVSLAAAE
jgi:type II secretory pathway component PulK